MCVRVPWGNDTEYKCTGSARDGPAHVEVFALQRGGLSVQLALGASVRVIAGTEGFCRLPRKIPGHWI